MKVIAAGFPKTGTKSVCKALRTLGYTVYDFEENSTYLADDWAQILHHGWTTEHFQKMYKDIDAVTDYPACCFWEEIYKAFPDSKIILMIRDDEESWFTSAANQIREGESKMILRLFTFDISDRKQNDGRIAFGINDSFLWKPFSLSYLNEQLMKLKYRAHNAYVLQNAPPEKLLVFKCSEGWEPLCKFLDVSDA
uniref:uncharacterized protein LOC120347915 n=1 Tax=Styela clava TaxID=7725 RepID=UPI001939C186|nr:uncharacterized protein LOC120347915 [Styela clava]